MGRSQSLISCNDQYKNDGNMFWRITCSYGEKGWNERDLVIENDENAPVLKEFTAVPVCLNFSYIDIQDYNC